MEKYDVFEDKERIVVFKRTLFSNLKFWQTFTKEYYDWEQDSEGKMDIIIKRADKHD